MTDIRAQFTASLRELANWLDAHPDYELPVIREFNVPLHTNAAVAEFAQRHELETAADEEGNLSTRLQFGEITYHAYGYVDFAKHLAATRERDARYWAEKNGMDLVARAGE